ncbi:hypothetical protein GCM10025857_24380 [Alicyclobacillus contaminans]|uniref:hypothetical protein n=1 Tax=Alicyclobacillus contaminans TaxID=392016 RepID=UPI0004214463|nr:hypothetical protein [Alicyclobacillus contaminans]GMA51081.1 hypothetical protein GCM10025857_24380 [Alicyclobacillus contaminans]
MPIWAEPVAGIGAPAARKRLGDDWPFDIIQWVGCPNGGIFKTILSAKANLYIMNAGEKGRHILQYVLVGHSVIGVGALQRRHRFINNRVVQE